MSTSAKSVNAWILLMEDEPKNTSYKSPDSCYQSLIKYGVYNYTDMVSVCWVNTLPTSPSTVPAGDGSTHTVQLQTGKHPDGSTNQQSRFRAGAALSAGPFTSSPSKPARQPEVLQDIQEPCRIGMPCTRVPHWKEHDSYQMAFERLLRDLKTAA